MPEIPQPKGNLSLTTPNFVPFQNRPVDTYSGYTILSKGLSDLARGTISAMSSIDSKKRYDFEKKEALERSIQAVREKRDREDRVFEASKMTSQVHRDWFFRVKEYEKSPSEDLLTQFDQEFDEYSTKLLEGIGDETLRREMELQLLQTRNKATGDVFALETAVRQANFAGDLDTMFQNAQDVIYADKTVDSLAYQQSLIENSIGQALSTGRIRDESTAQALLDKVGKLSVSWAYANMGTNPQAVLDMLSGKTESVFKGIDSHQREILRRAAKTAVEAKTVFDSLANRKAHDTNIENITKFGQPTSDETAYLDAVEASNGKTARDVLKRDIDMAYRKYDVSQDTRGATAETLASINQRVSPKQGAPSEEFVTYRELAPVIAAAESERVEDPFKHFMRHPSIETLVIDNEGNTSAAEVVDRVLELQRQDPTIAPHEYAVMTNDDVDTFVNDFNQAVSMSTDSESVYSTLQGLHTTYGGNTQLAIRQIARKSQGTTIFKMINPLMWHFDNPTVFKAIADSVRKDNTEELKKLGKQKEINNFNYEITHDPNFLKYRQSIDAYDSSPEGANYVNGVLQSFHAFARDQVVAGGNVSQASSIFFNRYVWSDYNGVPIALPRKWQDPSTGESGETHLMTGEQQFSFNTAMETFLDGLADKNLIDPNSIIPVTDFMNEDDIRTDIQQQMKNNVYFVTGPNETELLLYVRGSILGSARQVTDKQGQPISIPIAHLLGQHFDSYFDHPQAIMY